ncbi:MAG TPA: glutaredoxin 3 [Actinomycetota bacterium]
MVLIEIYTTPWCPYCHAAKRLLEERGIAFEETDVSGDPELRAEIGKRSGRRTVPQIFIDGEAIGGYDELRALDEQVGLGALVGNGNGDA